MHVQISIAVTQIIDMMSIPINNANCIPCDTDNEYNNIIILLWSYHTESTGLTVISPAFSFMGAMKSATLGSSPGPITPHTLSE